MLAEENNWYMDKIINKVYFLEKPTDFKRDEKQNNLISSSSSTPPDDPDEAKLHAEASIGIRQFKTQIKDGKIYEGEWEILPIKSYSLNPKLPTVQTYKKGSKKIFEKTFPEENLIEVWFEDADINKYPKKVKEFKDDWDGSREAIKYRHKLMVENNTVKTKKVKEETELDKTIKKKFSGYDNQRLVDKANRDFKANKNTDDVDFEIARRKDLGLIKTKVGFDTIELIE